MTDSITICGARLHNLKNVTLAIPKHQLVVFTGISGSGKSTLGFDILSNDGVRQYMEALGMVTFKLTKPPVDAITGLSPTVSVDQHLTNHSPRSTVGTTTEIYTYLRILFARLGRRPCPRCGRDVPPLADLSTAQWEADETSPDDAAAPEATYPCPHCGAPVPELGMAHFSFNKPAGACPTCTGLGVVHEADVTRLVDDDKSIADGAVLGWDDFHITYYGPVLRAAAAHYGLVLDLSLPVKDFAPPQRDLLLYGVESSHFRRHFPNVEPPATVRRGRFEGVVTSLLRRYGEHLHEHAGDAGYRDKLEDFLVTQVCPGCAGTRLRPESRAVTVNGQSIVALARLPLIDLRAWLAALPASLAPDELLIAEPILADLETGIARVVEVGAGYLTLERPSTSTSVGEAQRLRLASLLGSSLSGLLYVFDEPTIGLHCRDTHRLIAVLRRLRDLGNTVLVVEHDLDVIAAADYVVDFGPGAGKHGGQVVATGTPTEIAEQPGSITGDYLSGRASIPVPQDRRSPGGSALTIRGARHHNLQNLTVRLPLGVLVAVTGVSGSGKSSLVFDILDRALRQRLYGGSDVPGEHDAIDGLEQLDKVITVDQEHIGRLPRSNAATYSDAFTPIREAFAATADARSLGLTARHFSFNVPGGRCERCQGVGTLTVKMHFLPDVDVHCPACRGRRFTAGTLAVRYRDHDISQVLDLTVEEALALFADVPAVRARLQVLVDVGLGYLQLGQPATTLSGGEAQRVKLAKELGRGASAWASWSGQDACQAPAGHPPPAERSGRPGRRVSRRTLYLLDEPTTGLHPADTARLLSVLQRLVDAGNAVVVVEHNLDIIKTADWILDLGPEGGAAGGTLIAEGTPEQIAATPGSYTGRALRGVL